MPGLYREFCILRILNFLSEFGWECRTLQYGGSHIFTEKHLHMRTVVAQTHVVRSAIVVTVNYFDSKQCYIMNYLMTLKLFISLQVLFEFA